MKTICLYFEIHQNIHLKRYRFFDIGTDHYYYDDYENERGIVETAERSYIPSLKTLIAMAKENKGYFKCSLSLSGCTIELLEIHAPQVIELIQELVDTGCCELLAEPYSHGLASLGSEAAFREEVKALCDKVNNIFGQQPKVFRNSALIYTDEIGRIVHSMGFKGMLAEGAKQVLGWKSPHYVYSCANAPKLKLLLRDAGLSEDISYRFNDSSWASYPLFADTYMDWIAQQPEEEQVYNLFMELCALGIFQPLSSNILEFMHALPEKAKERGITFSTCSEVCSKFKATDTFSSPDPITWVDETRDISPWLGNDMQRDAFRKLYNIADRVLILQDKRIKQDWDYLQATNNFRFMSTKPGSEGAYRGIYDSPYDAFTNYMNIISDFITRVNNYYPAADNEELSALLTTIRNQEDELNLKDREIEKLRKTIHLLGGEEPKKPKAKKAAAKKAAPVKKEEPKKEEPKAAPAKKAEPAKKAPAKKTAPKKK
ncbi:MAG: glycoside hydrolase family 57 protein [Bacteroidaceae bacterium]|nr:glycoside hydrolase family 57 protein [Bacteroidaceae bacterium]